MNSLSETKPKKRVLEIIRDDKTISNDTKEVLNKWFSDFSESFSGFKNNQDLAYDDVFLSSIEKLKEQLELLTPTQIFEKKQN